MWSLSSLCIVLYCIVGKHQCRALAESMFSPSQGLKEIAHQLSTGVAQELIHYCNSLRQGVSLYLWPVALF